MSDATPSSDPRGTAPSGAHGGTHFGMSSPQLTAMLVGWVVASGVLYLISRAEWWLCLLGGLGVLLVIWPGPKSKPRPQSPKPPDTKP